MLLSQEAMLIEKFYYHGKKGQAMKSEIFTLYCPQITTE